jgi:hypothetical protein
MIMNMVMTAGEKPSTTIFPTTQIVGSLLSTSGVGKSCCFTIFMFLVVGVH